MRERSEKPTAACVAGRKVGRGGGSDREAASAPDPMPSVARSRPARAVILSRAEAQHGVVSRAQLLQEGVSGDVLDRRVASGWLKVVHRGVYRLGPAAARYSREMAAVLACGGGTFVSHATAAALWRLLRRVDGDVHVVRPGGKRVRPGIRVHRVRSLRPDETTKRHGIPITTPTRTLLDLAAGAPRRELERALAEAFALRLTDRPRLDALLARHAGRRGTRRLRMLLGSDAEPQRTRSAAEEAFLELVRKGRLPRPKVNHVVRGFEVDFYWTGPRLGVEIDGYAFHATRRRFESDHRRDAIHAAAGIRILRFTWRQIVDEPDFVLVSLARTLAIRER